MANDVTLNRIVANGRRVCLLLTYLHARLELDETANSSGLSTAAAIVVVVFRLHIFLFARLSASTFVNLSQINKSSRGRRVGGGRKKVTKTAGLREKSDE